MAVENINSILVADLGNVHTRLVLFDLVEGEYRMIASSRARTTAAPPLGKVSLGVERAARRMTELIDREIIDESGQELFRMPESEGHGIDAFLVTGSAGRPMRVFLVGLTPEISLASGRRVLAGSYATITDMLCPDDLRSEEEQINALLVGEPDVVLIVGGTDDGADELLIAMVEKVERAFSLIRRGTIPTVLYAGNPALRNRVKALLGAYTTVFTARNVRPAVDDEQLFPAQIELALVYDEYCTRSQGGFDAIGRYSQVGIVPTTQGYISAMRYMAQLSTRTAGPLCVDVGSASSLIVAGVRQEPSYNIRPDLGIGHNFPAALDAITPDRLRRWLPFDISDADLWDFAYNKQLRPATIPGTLKELQIEQAMAREIIRELVRQARPAWGLGVGELLPDFAPIIGAGAALTDAPHPGVAAMLLLDALQPVGTVSMQLDPHNLVVALGVVAYLKPIVTVQALERGGLIDLGPAFCPLGRVRHGREAMLVQIRPPDGEVIRRVVRGGEIWMAPVLAGTRVEVTIRLRRGLAINGKRRIRRRVVAGSAGLIFDARGRPLPVLRPQERPARLTAWYTAMMGGQLPEDPEPSALEALMPDLSGLLPGGEVDLRDTLAFPAWGEEEADAFLP